jgi:hypothetical protein
LNTTYPLYAMVSKEDLSVLTSDKNTVQIFNIPVRVTCPAHLTLLHLIPPLVTQNDIRSICTFITQITRLTSNFLKKVKVKQSRYTPWRRLGERRYSSYSFSTSALDGGEWSASRHGPAFTPGERTPGTHWVGGPQSRSGHRG